MHDNLSYVKTWEEYRRSLVGLRRLRDRAPVRREDASVHALIIEDEFMIAMVFMIAIVIEDSLRDVGFHNFDIARRLRWRSKLPLGAARPRHFGCSDQAGMRDRRGDQNLRERGHPRHLHHRQRGRRHRRPSGLARTEQALLYRGIIRGGGGGARIRAGGVRQSPAWRKADSGC